MKFTEAGNKYLISNKMIQFIRKDENGVKIYMNTITGQEGTIAQIGRSVTPSDRVNKRHGTSGIAKVRSNRKPTKGRRIYYQVIALFEKFDPKKGKGKAILNELGEQKTKTVKHVQESSNAIQRKTSLLNFYDRVELNKAKWHEKHPEYKAKNK